MDRSPMLSGSDDSWLPSRSSEQRTTMSLMSGSSDSMAQSNA